MTLKKPTIAIIMAVSAVVFVLTVTMLAMKIADYNKRELPGRAYFMLVDSQRFTYGGRPVEFTEEINDSNQKYIIIRFGEQTLRIAETIANPLADVPDLRRYEDWLHVYRFVIVKDMSPKDAIQGIVDDTLDDRLAIVVRTPTPGADHRTWGEVWSDRWMFDLYEFTEDGQIIHDRLKYPSKRKGNEPPKEGELIEGTWQFDAAMTSIPPVSRPKPQFMSDASLEFGWDFAIAGVTGLVFALAAGFLFAPNRRTEESDAAELAAAEAK